MSRATGGSDPGATSTRSIPSCSASHNASSVSLTPIWAPSGATTRTCLARIRSFTRGSLAIWDLLRRKQKAAGKNLLPVTSACRGQPGGKQRASAWCSVVSRSVTRLRGLGGGCFNSSSTPAPLSNTNPNRSLSYPTPRADAPSARPLRLLLSPCCPGRGGFSGGRARCHER